MVKHDYFLGLESPVTASGPNTERFSFVDGNETERDFFAERGVFPWATEQPDDAEGFENCVL